MRCPCAEGSYFCDRTATLITQDAELYKSWRCLTRDPFFVLRKRVRVCNSSKIEIKLLLLQTFKKILDLFSFCFLMQIFPIITNVPSPETLFSLISSSTFNQKKIAFFAFFERTKNMRVEFIPPMNRSIPPSSPQLRLLTAESS